jgi:hypothetical protein
LPKGKVKRRREKARGSREGRERGGEKRRSNS